MLDCLSIHSPELRVPDAVFRICSPAFQLKCCNHFFALLPSLNAGESGRERHFARSHIKCTKIFLIRLSAQSLGTDCLPLA